MGFTEVGYAGNLTGTVPVTIVPVADASDVTIRNVVRYMNIHNADTASVDIRIYVTTGTNEYTIWEGTLSAGDTWIWGDGHETLILDTTKSVEAVLDADPATENPHFVSTWAEVTDVA